MQEGGGPHGASDADAGGWQGEEVQRRVSAVGLGHLAGVAEGHRCWAAVVQGTGDLGHWRVPKLQRSSLEASSLPSLAPAA